MWQTECCRFSAVGIPPLKFISPGFSAMFNSKWSGEFGWDSSSEWQPYSRHFLKRLLFTGGKFISRGLAFYPLGFGKRPSTAHWEMAAVSRPLPQINKQNKIKQTGFMKWKCLICVFLSSTRLHKLKPRAAWVPSAPSSPPVSFDPDNPLSNDARDAVLSGGHHPGKTPFQPELWDEVATRFSKGVMATDGAWLPALPCRVWSRGWVCGPSEAESDTLTTTKKRLRVFVNSQWLVSVSARDNYQGFSFIEW